MTRSDLGAFVRDKLLAGLIALGVYYLQMISSDMREISKTLAVAVSRVDDHERRLEVIERHQHDDEERAR